MPLRHKVFAWIATLQLAGALCITIPCKTTPPVAKLRALCHEVQEPAASAMESVGTTLGVVPRVPNAPWPPGLTLTVLPLNILIWGMLLHFLSERVDFEPRHPTEPPHLRQ